MTLDVTVLGAAEAARKFDGPKWWDALTRVIPRALQTTVAEIGAAAPKGKTGKLSRGFGLRTRRVSEGLEVDIGAGAPYGHLIERGHRTIARGPGRQGANRGALRKQLKVRRASGSIGFVPANPFAKRVFAQDRAEAIRLIEQGLEQDLRAL